jgi:hypothetical protein
MMNVMDRPYAEELIETVEPTDNAVESIDVKKLLPFDWRKLMILGVSLDDAKRIAINLLVREIVPVYWRKLIELGVPINEAHDIAEAIAQKRPNREQKELIKRYCPTICRAELWRSKLLLA